jgi:hypothetical protein
MWKIKAREGERKKKQKRGDEMNFLRFFIIIGFSIRNLR